MTNLRTLDEIRKAFETLKCNEDKTDEELENLLSSHRLLIYHSFLIQIMNRGYQRCDEGEDLHIIGNNSLPLNILICHILLVRHFLEQ